MCDETNYPRGKIILSQSAWSYARRDLAMGSHHFQPEVVHIDCAFHSNSVDQSRDYLSEILEEYFSSNLAR